jgi:hypothetical protein
MACMAQGGGAGSCRAMSVILERERCPEVFSNQRFLVVQSFQEVDQAISRD